MRGDDTLAVGEKETYLKFSGLRPNGPGQDFGRVSFVFEVFVRDRTKGVLKVSRQTFFKQLADEGDTEFGRSVTPSCWRETCGVRRQSIRGLAIYRQRRLN